MPYQLLLAVTASLGYLTVGLLRGWSSTGMPSMITKSPHLVPSNAALSWASAVPPLGAFAGSLATGPLLQRLGRKRTLLLAAPSFASAWLLVGLAPTSASLILGRLLTGVCAGLVIPAAQVYVSESAQPNVRGVLGSLPALFMALGVLLAYLVGAQVAWDHLALLSSLFPAAMFFLLLPLPESPAWLRSRGRKREADRAAEWLRLADYTSVDLVAEGEGKIRGAYQADSLFRRPVLMPFGLVVTVLVFQQVSGIDTVLFYTVSIFEASGSAAVDEYLATALVGTVQLPYPGYLHRVKAPYEISQLTGTSLVGLVFYNYRDIIETNSTRSFAEDQDSLDSSHGSLSVQVVATGCSLFVIDRFGRKPLLVFSGALMAIPMAALGYYFYAYDRGLPVANSLGLLPVVSLAVFMAAYSLGYCNVPFLLMGELLPVAQRSVLSSVASAANLAAMFAVIKTYHDVKQAIGAEGVFWGYAALCALSCVFVVIFLPETKGKSLEEIEGFFEDKAQKRKDKILLKKNAQETCS